MVPHLLMPPCIHACVQSHPKLTQNLATGLILIKEKIVNATQGAWLLVALGTCDGLNFFLPKFKG